MTQQVKKKLNDSWGMRWGALAIVAFTMMAAYYVNDVVAPLKSMLEASPSENGLGWTSSDFGIYTGAYSFLNVFCLMLIWGGLILDRFGIRFTGKLATILMVVGTWLEYYAMTGMVGTADMILGYKADVFVASAGYSVFGVGAEVAGITVTKMIAKWFRGKEMATAMGVQVALARVGSQAAYAVAIPVARSFELTTPVLIGLVCLVGGMIAFFSFSVLDKKLDTQMEEIKDESSDDEKFSFKDVATILSNPGFWLIALLCVLFYSAVFPFLKYAPNLMINKFHIEPQLSGLIPMLLPFGNIILTPFFGNLYDRKGKGATIMLIGSVLLVFIHLMFSIPAFDHWIIALILVILLGIAFSLVPSAMWPSVPKIIPENKLGTAYALIFWVQNWGLMGVPFLIGVVLDAYCVTGITDGRPNYDYTIPMLIFACFGILAIIFAFLLKAEDKKKGYGLENPNIQK